MTAKLIKQNFTISTFDREVKKLLDSKKEQIMTYLN